ncbi:hypothetical protein J3459_018562, partial [Metarhizium acridum]
GPTNNPYPGTICLRRFPCPSTPPSRPATWPPFSSSSLPSTEPLYTRASTSSLLIPATPRSARSTRQTASTRPTLALPTCTPLPPRCLAATPTSRLLLRPYEPSVGWATCRWSWLACWLCCKPNIKKNPQIYFEEHDVRNGMKEGNNSSYAIVDDCIFLFSFDFFSKIS